MSEGQRLRAALEDQTRLFVPAQDVDPVAERFLGFEKKLVGVGRRAHRLGADGAHALRGDPREAFAKARERGQGARLRFGRERPVFVEPAREADGFLPVALRHDAFALNAGDDDAEAVAAEINGT